MAYSSNNPDWFYKRLFKLPSFIKDIEDLGEYIKTKYGPVDGGILVRHTEFNDVKTNAWLKSCANKYKISEQAVRDAVFMRRTGYWNNGDYPYAHIVGDKVVIEISGRVTYKGMESFWQTDVKPLQRKLKSYLGRHVKGKEPEYATFLFRAYQMKLNSKDILNELKLAAGDRTKSKYLKDLEDQDIPPWGGKEIMQALNRNLPGEVKSQLL